MNGFTSKVVGASPARDDCELSTLTHPVGLRSSMFHRGATLVTREPHHRGVSDSLVDVTAEIDLPYFTNRNAVQHYAGIYRFTS